MNITRTIEIKGLTPEELAKEFSSWGGSWQADFFGHLADITAEWPGAGWCQQCSAIAPELGPGGKSVIAKLAEWAADPTGENAS